jgi:cell division protein FtsQ
LLNKFLALLAWQGMGTCFSVAVLAAAGAYGAVKGGHYAAFVAAEGEPADILAKALGFSIKAVTISGERELKEKDLLAVAGIGPRNSLLFLDAAKVRDRLKGLALVKEAAVTKLYPGRVLIEIEERQPSALWQIDGQVKIVAEDGVPLGPMRDGRFTHLPFVAGPGANEKLSQYVALLEAAGDLREKITAGIRVGGRRWTLRTSNGIDILLPEIAPEAAVARLAELQRSYHVLDKDILSLDLRQPGRLAVRLTEEAAAERAAALASKTKAKGGRT